MATDSPSPGPGVDAQGRSVVDPTANVLDLVRAAMLRQDDLRAAESRRVDEIANLRSMYGEMIGKLRAAHTSELANKESQRVDAIRATSDAQVTRAAEVAADQAATLATQLETSATTLRASVEASAKALAETSEKQLIPIRQDVADLRRIQYEQAGSKATQTEAKGTNLTVIGLVITALAFIVTVIYLITYISGHP